MTYDRVLCQLSTCSLESAVVSHSAELVRGDLLVHGSAPHPAFGHLLPKGFSCERTWVKMCRFDSARGGVHG